MDSMTFDELDDLLESVYRNADERWKDAAGAAVTSLAKDRQEFTADDVWELIDGTDVGTHENRAMGPVMRAASKAMIIQRTDRTIKTRRPSRNKGDVRVWRSLIYSGGQND